MRILSFALVCAGLAAGAEPGTGLPVRVVITAEPHHGADAPVLSNGDVAIHLGKERIAAKEVLPLQGEHAGLQFAILIDDGADSELGLQFDDLRQFIRSQPASTQFGVYYMRNGAAVAAHKMSADHEAAAKSFRLPLGQSGAVGDPYDALKDLVKNWPKTTDRREVLMLSSGVGLYRGTPPTNPYLGSAIAECQREGVLVHSIYFHGAGHMGHDYYLINFGREGLSYLGDETGGECYWQGLSTSTSFQPYLKDLAERLNRQYMVIFYAQPGKKAELQQVKYRTELANVELIGAEMVLIPGR
jgi:hypothetical protein